MGVLQSSIHFENLNGVIENQSGYQIKYKVTGPFSEAHEESSAKYLAEQTGQEKLLQQNEDFLYAGLVSPYATKYFSFNNIQTAYRFSVFAIKLNTHQVYEIVPLEKNLKIKSQKSICLKITPQLKVIHLTNDEVQELYLRKNLESKIMRQSAIVKTPQLSHRFVQFFEQCPKDAEFLFKASDNQFDVNKFYELHGHTANVLVICKTDKNKVIGAFSKMPLIGCQQSVYDEKGWTSIHDPTSNSFIFSLTSNDIFRLKQSQPSTYYNKDKEQICFGKDQFRINNHSDRTQCVTQNLNTNYLNHNYTNDADSYRLLNGNESPEFTTKQWQVWHLQFKQVNTYQVPTTSLKQNA